MKIPSRIQCFGPIAFAAAIFCAASAHCSGAASPSPELSTSDIRVALSASRSEPQLVSIGGSASLSISNRTVEPLPSSVEIRRRQRSTHMAAQTKTRHRRRPSRYLCLRIPAAASPPAVGMARTRRLRTHRASHIIENLSDKEAWLPMVDSLRLDWSVPASDELRNFYVEKGAGTPSAQGTHRDTMTDGYRWTGNSSTYAHPPEGARAKSFPPKSSTLRRDLCRLVCRHRVQRTDAHQHSSEAEIGIKSVLGLDPGSGSVSNPSCTGGSFETPTVFLGALTGGPDGAGNQLRTVGARGTGRPEPWKDAQYPLVVNNSWGSAWRSTSRWRCA